MTKNNTETFYREIIKNVVDKMKEEFNNEGVGEDILNLLQKTWEEKMVQSGIFEPKSNGQNFSRGNFNPRPSVFINSDMRPQGTFNNLKFAPNNTTQENIKSYMERKNIQLAAKAKFTTSTHNSDYLGQNHLQGLEKIGGDFSKEKNGEKSNGEKRGEKEGNDDQEDKKSQDSLLDLFNTKKEKVDELKPDKEKDDESLSPLPSDSEDLEIEAKDYLLAQFEKVHRVKNKWKINFKDAVLHCNGKEFVFDKVVGELDRDW